MRFSGDISRRNILELIPSTIAPVIIHPKYVFAYKDILDKEYKRRITYESQDGEHLNHYVAMKKMPNSTTEAPILCDVVVRLTEIEPEPLYSKIEYKEDLNNKLHELSNLEEYKENEEENEENEEEDKEDKEENKNETFNYRNVGIFCIIIFVLYILIRKQ